jgi:hypothetical protein
MIRSLVFSDLELDNLSTSRYLDNLSSLVLRRIPVEVRIETSIVIDRPAVEVFEFVAIRHRENHSRWDVAVSRLVPETPGPLGLGSRFTIVRRNLREEEARTFTITEWVPPRLMEMRTSAPGFELTLRGEFEAIRAAVTRHILVCDVKVAGMRGLLMPVMKVKFTRDLQRDMERIKTLIEAEGKVPAALREETLG